jgi:hypothetical protein
MNPYVAFRAWLVHRKGGLYKLIKDPDTDELIPYARERMLNPIYLKTLFRKSNYKARLTEYHGFVPPKFNDKRLFRFIERILTNIPIFRLMGSSYIIVGKKSVCD